MGGRKMKVSRILAVAVIAFMAWPGIVGAQSFKEPKPLPPKKDPAVMAAVAAAAAAAATANAGAPSPSTWLTLPNQPPVLDIVDCGPGSPILLTDGTVLLADVGCQDWWRLKPDAFGSYVNGTWTQAASTPAGYTPVYHASAVLPDGRLIIEGGEYNQGQAVWTTQGAIY